MTEKTAETTKPKVLIALGSPSDMKILGKKISKNDLDLFDWHISIASAHRTPKIVQEHAKAQQWDAVIAGAGLTNALLSEYIKNAKPETIILGLPIRDEATNGLTSLLSSQELPTGYVSAIVGTEDVHKAKKITAKLLLKKYNKIAVWYSGDKEKDRPKKTEEILAKFGIEYRLRHEEKNEKEKEEEITLAVGQMREVKEILNPDLVVASITNTYKNSGEKMRELTSYDYYIHFNPNLIFTGFNNQTNLALFGAKVISRNNPAVAEKIKHYLEEGKKKYEKYKQIIQLTKDNIDEVVGGE